MNWAPRLIFIILLTTMTSLTDALAPFKRDGYFVLKIMDYKEDDFPQIVGSLSNYYDFLDIRTLESTVHLP